MKTIIEIVGVGERRAGTGKTGKPYDIVSVAFTYEDKRMNGVNAGNCVIDGAEIEKHGISPGTTLEVVLMYRNYQPYIAVIL